jgi:glycosyltransferase involved in cell wall biosynthesis
MKISIVTVTYNNFEIIEQTIKSVLNQNYSDLEYIVIDGGSTDGTLKILDRYKSKFKYFKSSKDKGVYDAMNKGIAQASGDLIGFVNGGDFIYENTLHNINELFAKQKSNFLFSVADIDYIDNNNNIVGTKICRSKEQILKKKYIEMPTNHLGIFVPLKAFKEHGLFDLRFKYRADFLFVLKLMREGYEPLNIRKKIGAFRLGGISGGYSTFLENYKIIRIVGGNFLIAFYSTILGLSKFFLKKNFLFIFNYLSKVYYKLNKNLQKKEKFTSNYKIIHIIDSDLGGGAEKLVFIIQQNFEKNQKIITLKELSEKNKFNSNYRSLNIKNDSLWSVIWATFGIIKIIFKMKDRSNLVLHSHLSKSLYASFLPTILFGIDHIYTEHNTHNKRRSKSYLYPIEYLIYKSLKHVICISEPTKFELLSYMPSIRSDKISVIENGTKLLKHKDRDFKKKLNILILGSLTFKKGIDLFIEILPSLSNRINQVKIIGSGEEEKRLINLSKKLSLESIIKFIPFTDDPSKHIYESHVGVIPSRWEGFGLVAAEMRSSGLPILISDTPGLYNIFSGYNGVYSFKSESKESLKNSFRLLLDNLSNNRVKVKNLREDFEIYSEKSFIKRIENFYKNL